MIQSSLFALLSIAALAVAPSSGSELSVEQEHRKLGGPDLPYNPLTDICKVGEQPTGEDIYGPCDESEFRTCDPNKEFICYNRINRRDLFHRGDRQPLYFIDPRRILCYPNSWLSYGGCSTCTPGRFCRSEDRCILEEIDYDCAEWL